MAKTNQTNPGNTQTAATTAAKKSRKPPVIDRSGVNASTAPAATAAPTASTTPAATPAATTPTSTTGTTSTDFPVNAPPVVTVPSVPGGFVPVNALDLRGYRPMQSELASVPDAILELTGFANYSGIFGITAPPAAQVSQRLSVASQWTALFAQTSDWYTYVKSQEGMAWKDALELIESLKVPFQLASASNPALLSQYPALARMLGAQKVVAKRAASTRAKNQKAAAATTPAPAAPATAAPAEAPAAAPQRVVTVQG